MKKYLPVPVAALVAFIVAAAISSASIPDGSGVIHGCYQPVAKGQAGGNLSVIDSASQECPEGSTALGWHQGPALVASGWSEGKGGGSYEEGTTFFSPPESMTFTPSRDATCIVTLDGQILRDSGNGAEVTYGIAVKEGEGSYEFVGTYQVSTTPGFFGESAEAAASLARTALVSVEAGKTYTLNWGITVPEGSTGTAFPNENYICL